MGLILDGSTACCARVKTNILVCKSISIITVVALNKCLKQIEFSVLVYMHATRSQLPSDIGIMTRARIFRSGWWVGAR